MDNSTPTEQIVKTQCVLCVGGCGLDVHLRNGEIVAVEGMREHPHNEGALCPRGAAAVEYNKSPERLMSPLRKDSNGWKEISWDEAIDTIASELSNVKEKYGVQGFVFHGSCTHHQNLTTKEDYVKVFDEIDRLVDSTEVHDTISGPHWTDKSKFKVWSLFIGDDVLTINTSAPEFTDDIALDVGKMTASKVREKHPEIRNISIVDAHNCIDDDAVSVMLGDAEAAVFADAVEGAIGLTKTHQKQPVSIEEQHILHYYSCPYIIPRPIRRYFGK